MKKLKVITLIILVNLVCYSTVSAQKAPYNERKTRFEKSLDSLMNIANRVLRGNYLMQFEGKVKNEAHIFGFAIYVNNMGVADSIVFTNKSSLLDSIVSFSKIEESVKMNKSIFQNHKNTVIVSMGLVERHWDEYICNAEAFKNQLFSVFPKLYPENKQVIIVGPVPLGAVISMD